MIGLHKSVEELVETLKVYGYTGDDNLHSFCQKMSNAFGEDVVCDAIDYIITKTLETEECPKNIIGFIRAIVLKSRRENRTYRPKESMATKLPQTIQTLDTVGLRHAIQVLHGPLPPGFLPQHWTKKDLDEEIEFLQLVLEEWDEINNTISKADPMKRGQLFYAYQRYRETEKQWKTKLAQHKLRWTGNSGQPPQDQSQRSLF